MKNEYDDVYPLSCFLPQKKNIKLLAQLIYWMNILLTISHIIESNIGYN